MTASEEYRVLLLSVYPPTAEVPTSLYWDKLDRAETWAGEKDISNWPPSRLAILMADLAEAGEAAGALKERVRFSMRHNLVAALLAQSFQRPA